MLSLGVGYTQIKIIAKADGVEQTGITYAPLINLRVTIVDAVSGLLVHQKRKRVRIGQRLHIALEPGMNLIEDCPRSCLRS